MRNGFAIVMSAVVLSGLTNSIAHGQATRTWVSGVGDDVNPCSRTAPCKTFAGAISKTATNGEINCLDPGGFGAVTITKSISIDCTGTLGGILAASGTTGIVINAGTTGVVKLRNLDIHGSASGLDGVRFMNGKQLIIENTRISGFTRIGVYVQTMTGIGSVVINNSTISAAYDGIVTDHGITTVSNSVITGHSWIALIAEGVGVINAHNNLVTNNVIAVQAGSGAMGQANATVRISGNEISGNANGLVCGGGVLASDGTNRMSNNTGGSTPTCAPNAVITKQ